MQEIAESQAFEEEDNDERSEVRKKDPHQYNVSINQSGVNHREVLQSSPSKVNICINASGNVNVNVMLAGENDQLPVPKSQSLVEVQKSQRLGDEHSYLGAGKGSNGDTT